MARRTARRKPKPNSQPKRAAKPAPGGRVPARSGTRPRARKAASRPKRRRVVLVPGVRAPLNPPKPPKTFHPSTVSPLPNPPKPPRVVYPKPPRVVYPPPPRGVRPPLPPKIYHPTPPRVWVAPDLNVILRGPRGDRGLIADRMHGRYLELADVALKSKKKKR